MATRKVSFQSESFEQRLELDVRNYQQNVRWMAVGPCCSPWKVQLQWDFSRTVVSPLLEIWRVCARMLGSLVFLSMRRDTLCHIADQTVRNPRWMRFTAWEEFTCRAAGLEGSVPPFSRSRMLLAFGSRKRRFVLYLDCFFIAFRSSWSVVAWCVLHCVTSVATCQLVGQLGDSLKSNLSS